MPEFTSPTIVAVTAIALWAKGVLLSLTQVAIRVRSRRYGRPEDARMMGYEPMAEDERIERLSRAWRNELETVPAFLALAVGHVLTGGSPSPFWIVCLVFVLARYAQGWAQFTLRQPLRTIAFLIGMSASIAMVMLLAQSLSGMSI